MNDKRYIIRDREAGNEIENFKTLKEAKKTLTEYEENDKKEGIFEPNFYEIYDNKLKEIIN